MEGAVCAIQVMYSNAQSHIHVNSQYNYEFGVGVNVHQDSALSPLLFIPVWEALSHEFSIGVPWELLLTNDLLLISKELHQSINGRTVDVSGTMLDVEATFCYLCGILCCGAIAASCAAWGKFRKLLSVLTARYLSPRICGKVYEACVCPNNYELHRHLRNDCAMIRWICGIKDRDEIFSGSRLQKLGIEDISLHFQ